MKILITGQGGLIGGACMEYLGSLGHEMVGIENNAKGNIDWNIHRVANKIPPYKNHTSDVRNFNALMSFVFVGSPYDVIIHAADCETDVLIKAIDRHSPKALFISFDPQPRAMVLDLPPVIGIGQSGVPKNPQLREFYQAATSGKSYVYCDVLDAMDVARSVGRIIRGENNQIQKTKTPQEIFEEIQKQFYWGTYSNHEDTLNYRLNKDDVMLDVGGYRGSWTESVLNRQSCNVRAYVLEPVAEFAEACRQRFKKRRNVAVIPFGLSDRDEVISISKQAMHSSAYADLPYDSTYGNAVPEMIQLKDVVPFLDRFGFKEIALMGMNVEGGEYKILRRLIDTSYIQRIRDIQIAFHDFYPNAKKLRDELRLELNKTHIERFNYPWTWEGWRRR